MATTASEGFRIFLGWLTPTETERQAAASHRASIEAKLDAKFGIYRMFQSGSFKHGTGVSGHSDVDYFVSLKSIQPSLSSSTLTAVRDALIERFPSTPIHVARPAVVLEFGQGAERVEVIPAYGKGTASSGDIKYEIPGVTTEWLESTPEAHLDYVNECNSKAGVRGGAKSLARLAKAWKYYRNVPVSSFYLEMRAAAYMAGESSISYPYDLYNYLKDLQDRQLAAMNDPTGSSGRIRAYSSETTRVDALSKLDTAVSRASKALDAYKNGDLKTAFEQWNLLFNYEFPSYG